MICPNKICKQEIPDDSLYCDQCGLKILRCSKCGAPGIGKHCGKCGGAMVFSETQIPAGGKPSTACAPEPQPAPVPQKPLSSSATIVVQAVQAAQKKLLFCHPDGWNMEIAGGDILGRTTGNRIDRLGSIPIISGKHAQVSFENETWYITDLQSTNKTYVGNVQAQPGTPYAIKNNDMVQLANVKFIVREQ
jgi:hypothetical protein